MITPRATRLVRVPDLEAFREAVVSRACEGAPADARDRLIIVPTRAAAAHLLRTLEDRALASRAAVLLPDLVTPRELVERLAERLVPARTLTGAEREVLLGVAARAARDAGAEPPFRLRPGLIAEMLRFYDTLRLNGKDVDAFERLALSVLEPGASYDRGAERLVRQTRFLAAALREFERRCAGAGADIHRLRERLVATRAARPFRHVVVTVADAAFDSHGLAPAHWDLLARLPGLERLDVIVTETMLAGALHERFHRVLPGIDEVRPEPRDAPRPGPVLLTPPSGRVLHVARDREEEVAGFARRVKQMARQGDAPPLDRVALVMRQPLPYLYVGREVLRSGGIPCQLFDALPLAAEPYAAAVDLVLSCVTSDFARAPAVALMRSPHFDFTPPHRNAPESAAAGAAGEAALRLEEVAALDRALSESSYSGGLDQLERLVVSWRAPGARHGVASRAERAAGALLEAVRELSALRADAPAASHLSVLGAFLASHDRLPGHPDPLLPRHLRARAAVLGTIATLRDAYARFDEQPVAFDVTAARLRRWIDGQTFAPQRGDAGVHIVDAGSARFGTFDFVQVAGLVEGEWPERPSRNIFYSTSILRDLGWPAESERLDGARAAFADLLRLPARALAASAFTLEADAIVTPSPLVEEIERAALEPRTEDLTPRRIFDYEAVAAEAAGAELPTAFARAWLHRRRSLRGVRDPRYRGITAPHLAEGFSVSGLERYQDCPFKFFAADVLRLQEAPEDEPASSPRARGRFLHEVFQRFFEAWGARGGATITAHTLPGARRAFAEVAEPLLATLSESDAALERTRLFGSAISLGIVEVVLALEASRPADVRERWLEYRLEGAFGLGAGDGHRVALRGVADRIDILSGNRLRVIDYKSGGAPNPRRALQVPVYALCAQERLAARDGERWTVEDASYVAFSGRRPLVPVVKAAAEAEEVLAGARGRLRAAVDAIGRGEFPPRPHDPAICRYCAYPSVCRKDYVAAD